MTRRALVPLCLLLLAGRFPVLAQEIRPLAAMSQRFVFWDDRLDSVGQAQHQERLVPWLVANGFAQVKSEALVTLMQQSVKAGDAYGTAVVMPMGFAPPDVAEVADGKPLWIRFLAVGGRIVSVGDLPFNYFEYPDARPLPAGISARGWGALGLGGGWNQPFWGRNLEVKPTPQAAEWGFETMDGSITGFSVDQVTIPFGTYTVPETGKLGATSWLKNVAPTMPLSGLIKMCQFFDGRNDAQLRDIWRAANYTGQPVSVPPLPRALPPPVSSGVVLKLTASAIPGRTAFARGEGVEALVSTAPALGETTARLELIQGGKVLAVADAAPRQAGDPEHSWRFRLGTAPYTFGKYTLRAVAFVGTKAIGEATQVVQLCAVPPEGFNWHVWVGSPANPLRRDFTFADIKTAGMEPHLTDLAVEGMDAILRQNSGFSLRMMPDLTGGKEYTYEKSPQFFRLNLERKPIPSDYAGGRPTLGISQPEILDNARRTLRDPLKPLAMHPAWRPYVLTNDDYTVYYGWDFSPHVCDRFKRETGLDAPTKKVDPPFGVVDDDHPWLKWFEFTLKEITGGLNRAETQGITEARPDARVGPIPGGMQIPFIHIWEAGQYPPLNFGPNGFNLISCYYYNTYWQPVLTNTYWMEIGRMGNRDLPEWCMPDLFMTAGYTRNNLYHLLAGGVKGLAYYTYSERNPGTWAEVRRLAPTVRRIGPMQARLKPAPTKDIGMLVSLTTNCFDPGHDLLMVYAYENLMQAHFDVEMTCEEEILAGRASQYKAIVLYNVRWLRKSVFDALAAHAARGGLVLLDSTVPFDIPGAKRIPIDLGMGNQATLGMPPEGAHAATPGIRDYGNPERVAAIGKAVGAFVKPRFDCPDIRLVASRFEADGTPYTWFVNAHTGKEYMYCRERMGAGHPGSGTPEKIAEVIAWEKQEAAAGPYKATAVFPMLPGVPYDLVAGKPVPTRKVPGGVALDLTMERFGGSLVAFYPEAILRVALSLPATAKPMTEVAATVRVLGSSGPIAGAVPVELTLTDPSGKTSILSGVRATIRGVLTFRWTPATNDPPGLWTLKATELASGKVTVATVTVR